MIPTDIMLSFLSRRQDGIHIPPKSSYSTLDRPTSDGCWVVESARSTVLISPIVPQWNLYRTEMMKHAEPAHTYSELRVLGRYHHIKLRLKDEPRYMTVIR